MNVRVDIPVPPPRKFVLTLDENEASALRSLMGNITNQSTTSRNCGPVSRLIFDIYHALAGYGLEASMGGIFEDGQFPQVAKDR